VKVYVASRFTLAGVFATREVQRLCRDAGHTITFDWTGHFDAALRLVDSASGLLDAGALSALEAKGALEDFKGASDADVLILIPYEGIKGALVEVGIALGSSASVLVIGDDKAVGLFRHLPGVEQIDDVSELPAWLAGMEGA